MTAPDNLGELLELASGLACSAGELIEGMRAGLEEAGIDEQAQTKSSAADVVTEADKAAERLILEGLVSTRPDDGILGEEGSDRAGTTGVRWLIDPIDGTTNYVYDLPAYTVSIAAEIDNRFVVGVVYEPKGNTLFSASLGGGAFRNGEAIRCNPKSELATALIATGFGYLADRRQGQAEVLLQLLPHIRDIRRFGSAALDLCLLATGQVDGYYERGLNSWDLAAGVLIAAEAGATVGDLRGGPPGTDFVLGAAPTLFPLLREVLVEAGADRKP